MWNYLDKRRATIAALKDYDGMKFIINSYQDDLKLAKEQMIGVSSPRYGFVPGSSKKDNPTEHRLLHGIDETTKLNERYQQAQLYFKWFEPAWQELSEDERFVLDVCYRTPNQSMNEGLTIVTSLRKPLLTIERTKHSITSRSYFMDPIIRKVKRRTNNQPIHVTIGV